MGLGHSSGAGEEKEEEEEKEGKREDPAESYTPPTEEGGAEQEHHGGDTQSIDTFPSGKEPPLLARGECAYGKTDYQPNPEGAEVSFTVTLNCTPTGGKPTLAIKTLVIPNGMPLRVRDLKSCIESKYNIPACCQRLVFESVTMEDKMLLEFYHMRDGDSVHVNYVSEGNVSDILDVVDHMSRSYDFINSIQDTLCSHIITDDLDNQMNQNIKWDKVNDLPEVYFSPCSSDKSEANRNLFIQCGGLDILQRLHGLLLQQPWANMPLNMQYMEHSILRAYWNITASFTVRMYVLQYPRALGHILRSFQRVQLQENAMMKVPKNVYASRMASTSELNRIACEVVYKAMGALCNLAEIPECRMEIASNDNILKQLVATLMTPSYNSIASLVAMAGMLCLAYSGATHRFLATTTIISGVINACELQRPDHITESQKRMKMLLLKYFSTVLFAQLVTTSPHLLTPNAKRQLLQFMRDFLDNAHHEDIREEEVKNGYKWSTLVPFMKLVYHPYSRRPSSGTTTDAASVDKDTLELDRCCIQCGIFSLSNVLLCEQTREIFVQEGLLDYTVSMPWIFPHNWPERAAAHRLVSFLGQHMQLQPPSLLNLTKARLASMHFGLEKVLGTLSIHELLSEVYPS